ncbi:hypothetical protein EHJ13_12435 [Cronobacter dublinensis]|uniref:Uncharacterized protein n=1 Tax=Cronobacter dublinensis TaxID=413497 RepID=A0A9Q4T6B7_9ENTR|nr:hypothetical protein [Cronobacter dublinensis]EGT5738057.1 hypothetical protein [Cronobacter dublinensis subsp. dublinensis]NCH04862.1 hypothetical protein [Cronobacter dublinensis]NCH71146.1 hypothetical protein [Cronobacter dublinensis]NCH88231.1 hypothetical protein [Cronobacter dublinensis]
MFETIFLQSSLSDLPGPGPGYLNREGKLRHPGNGRKNSKKHDFFHLSVRKTERALALAVMGKYS